MLTILQSYSSDTYADLQKHYPTDCKYFNHNGLGEPWKNQC